MSSIPVLDDIPVTVITIADLRALVNHRNNEIVRVQATENDFRFSSSSFAVDDGISVVRPINVSVFQPGRWLVIVYPVDINVGAWTVLFTRKVPATTASDVSYVDTGIVYDSAYEYVIFGSEETSPTPSPTASATVATCLIATTCVVKYKPNGSTVLGSTNKNSVLIPANQFATGLVVDFSGIFGLAVAYQVDTAGKIYTKWTQNMSKDGHWVIARRLRYG